MADISACAASAADDLKARRGRIVFRAWRRGFREADLILGPFAERTVDSLNESELKTLEQLLEADDHALYGWATRATPCPSEFDGPLMERLQRFVDEHVAHLTARGGA